MNDPHEPHPLPLFSEQGHIDFDLDQASSSFLPEQPREQVHILPWELIDFSNASSGWQYSANIQPYHTAHAQHHTSDSVRSSYSSHARSSNQSLFSHHRWRGSVASTCTTWSNASSASKEFNVAHTERLLNANSTPGYSSIGQTTQEPMMEYPQPQTSQHQATSAKGQFLTCVSRNRRARRSMKEPRYWCTSCHEGFGEKYDWKRHEEAYQERIETYYCSLCKKTYFLEKDFLHHHTKSHRCQTCAEDKHADSARQIRSPKTGWGCGFCDRFDTDWTERCNHVARHFENGETIEKWRQTRVILSLLQQPLLRQKWNDYVDMKQSGRPGLLSFAFNNHTTGRTEDYPENGGKPQLQDLLEYFTHDEDAAALVRLAYEKGTKTAPDSPTRTLTKRRKHSPNKELPTLPSRQQHPDKELPRLPTGQPEMNQELNASLAAPDMMADLDIEPWGSIMDTILEDPMLPDSMAFSYNLEYGALGGNVSANFHHH